MDKRLNDLMKELGFAIDECLSRSDAISGVARQIRDRGFDVFLIVDVTAGFTPLKREDEDDAAVPDFRDWDFTADPQDLQFLKALHITAS